MARVGFNTLRNVCHQLDGASLIGDVTRALFLVTFFFTEAPPLMLKPQGPAGQGPCRGHELSLSLLLPVTASPQRPAKRPDSTLGRHT